MYIALQISPSSVSHERRQHGLAVRGPLSGTSLRLAPSLSLPRQPFWRKDRHPSSPLEAMPHPWALLETAAFREPAPWFQLCDSRQSARASNRPTDRDILDLRESLAARIRNKDIKIHRGGHSITATTATHGRQTTPTADQQGLLD